MKTFLFLSLSLILLASCSDLKKKYANLLEPKIRFAEKQKMLSMEYKGSPESATKVAGDLYNLFFKLDFKGKKMEAPRARWTEPFSTPRDQWISIWSLPVPDNIDKLPDVKTSIAPKLVYWYGCEVAEILHLGSYASEIPTIEKLHRYIADKGYEILLNTHEEEYIKGPGMFGKGNPDEYITIIRYEIRKK
jgi:hypothetical protein